MSVPALYIPAPGATPIGCTVRPWLRNDQSLQMDGVDGGAQMANTEDRLRFSLGEFAAPLRHNAVVSVEPGEAYRVDYLYPADLAYQTARVVRLTAAEAAGLPLPTEVPQAEGGAPSSITPYRLSYTHTQSVPAILWTVAHNLGFHPVVQVFDINGLEMDAVVAHLDLNNTEISLSSAMRGEARFV